MADDLVETLCEVHAVHWRATPLRELVARYAERSGREIADLPWYMALARWKGAIFLEGTYQRLLARSTDDPCYRGLDTGVPELLEEAWELVR